MSKSLNDRPDQWQDAAFTMPPKKKKQRPRGVTPSTEVVEDNVVTIGFDLQGKVTESPPKFIAKQLHNEVTGNNRYFIKFSTTGHNAGHMLNPVSLYFDEKKINQIDERKGRFAFEFKQVTFEVFNIYLHFLKTRVETHLRTAERLVLDP